MKNFTRTLTTFSTVLRELFVLRKASLVFVILCSVCSHDFFDSLRCFCIWIKNKIIQLAFWDFCEKLLTFDKAYGII